MYHNINLSTDDQRILDEVLQRAATDLGFREQLLDEPRGVLAEIAGQELPEDFVVRFIEKDEDTDALIVLPDLVPETAELSAAELEAVAGGQDIEICVYGATCQGISSAEVDIDLDG